MNPVRLASILTLAPILAAQQPAAPVPAANAIIPGTNVARCSTPHNPNAGTPLDNPDCDYWNTNPSANYAPTTVVQIPVVVHVIQNTSGAGYLSPALVQSQITVLNEDFRALAGTPGAPGVDTGIQFVLATADPAGNPTTGITYHTNSSWFNDSGNYWSTTSWDPQRYLNIYTNNAGGGGTLGYVPDLPQGGSVLNTSADRVVINYLNFGRPSLSGPPYNTGRTTTHEVGHYLGLFHTFENGCGSTQCSSSGDRICDTNAEANPRFGCPTGASSCSSADPIRNYMDYTNDACMTHFTSHQGRRMRCTLQHYRSQLAQPTGTPATATIRTGAGNLNTAHTCTPPRIGQNAALTVVTFNTGFTMATVFASSGQANVPYGAFTVLLDLNAPMLFQLPLASSPYAAQWSVPVPNVGSLAGMTLSTQGALLATGSHALTNAYDLVIGNY